MSELTIEAADKKATEIGKCAIVGTNGIFQGVPSFFRGNCQTAKRGGSNGYDLAGWHLGLHLADLLEPGDDSEMVASKLDELAKLLDVPRRNDKKILAWLKREFPKCIELVPSRRRSHFLQGIYNAHDDRNITT